jgi:hypothetical protein
MMSSYDAWRTREPDYGPDEPPPLPHCGRCGAFLRRKPDRIEPWEDGVDCDGTVTVVQQEYEEGTIAILGEEFRGKTYAVLVSACGTEIGREHPPHREVHAAGDVEYRTCRRCGHTSQEVTM